MKTWKTNWIDFCKCIRVYEKYNRNISHRRVVILEGHTIVVLQCSFYDRCTITINTFLNCKVHTRIVIEFCVNIYWGPFSSWGPFSHLRVGVGYPLCSQVRTAFSPAATFTTLVQFVISGGNAVIKSQDKTWIWCHLNCTQMQNQRFKDFVLTKCTNKDLKISCVCFSTCMYHV